MANKQRCASGSRSMVITSAGSQGQNLAYTALTVFLTRGGKGRWPWSKANPTVTPSGFTGFLQFRRPWKLKIHGHIREVFGWGTWIRTKIDGVRVRDHHGPPSGAPETPNPWMRGANGRQVSRGS